MIDYRFYKLNQQYINFLTLESTATADPDIADLKSSSHTRQDLVNLKHKMFEILKSFNGNNV